MIPSSTRFPSMSRVEWGPPTRKSNEGRRRTGSTDEAKKDIKIQKSFTYELQVAVGMRKSQLTAVAEVDRVRLILPFPHTFFLTAHAFFGTRNLSSKTCSDSIGHSDISQLKHVLTYRYV